LCGKVFAVKQWRKYFLVSVILAGIGFVMLYRWEPEYAYLPPQEKVLNPSKVKGFQTTGVRDYDLWGYTFTRQKVETLKTGNSLLSPAIGAVEINDDLLKLGRKTLYQETFGNEVFLTDIMGIVDGPLTITNIAKERLTDPPLPIIGVDWWRCYI
jgi:hypothetical protein